MENLEIPVKVRKPRQKRVVYGKMEDKPKTEQQLFKLESNLFKYRKQFKKDIAQWKLHPLESECPVDKSAAVWSQMLEIVFMYARSMILKRNKKKKMFTEMEDIEDKAIEAALLFMNQYNRREDFTVDASFAGALKYKIIEVLYGGKDDYHLSLNSMISDSNNTELMDSLASKMHNFITPNAQTPEEYILTQSNKDVVSEVLDELDEVVGKDSRLAFLLRLYLVISLRCPKTRHIKRIFIEHWADDYKTEQVLESTILELHNRLGESCIKDDTNE